MFGEPESAVSVRQDQNEDDEQNMEGGKHPHKADERPSVFKFSENAESKLFRQFLNNWEDTWQNMDQGKQGGNKRRRKE